MISLYDSKNTCLDGYPTRSNTNRPVLFMRPNIIGRSTATCTQTMRTKALISLIENEIILIRGSEQVIHYTNRPAIFDNLRKLYSIFISFILFFQFGFKILNPKQINDVLTWGCKIYLYNYSIDSLYSTNSVNVYAPSDNQQFRYKIARGW